MPPSQTWFKKGKFGSVATADSPAAERLRLAIEASPYSIRSLSRTIAGRPDVSADAESVRRSLGKWLAGSPISNGYRAILEETLELPEGELIDYSYSRAIELAAEFVKRLDAGESVSTEDLLVVADAAERAGEAARTLAARLRRDAASRRRRRLGPG